MEEIRVPGIGLGTFKISGEDVKDAISYAINSGYKLIDCASAYENQKEIGNTLKELNVLRQDIFLTSKVSNDCIIYDDVLKEFEVTVKDLGVDYLDLYLIHWPGSKERNKEVYKALEFLLENKKVKAIGVSNFQIHQLEDLLEDANIIPMMNQVELHPFLQQDRLLEYCMDKGIALTSYGSFAKGMVFENETLIKFANKYNKSVSQIVIKWCLQRGIFTIPKSVTKERIEENIDVFDFKLSMDDMKEIHKINSGQRLYRDPDNYFID